MRKDDELKSKHNNTQNEDVFFYTNGCFGFFSLFCCTPLISLAILTRVHLVSNL